MNIDRITFLALAAGLAAATTATACGGGSDGSSGAAASTAGGGLTSGHYGDLDLVVANGKVSGHLFSSVGDPAHGGATCEFTIAGSAPTGNQKAQIVAVDGFGSVTGSLSIQSTGGKPGVLLHLDADPNACSRASPVLMSPAGVPYGLSKPMEAGVVGYRSVSQKAFFYATAGGQPRAAFVVKGDTVIATGAESNGFLPAKYVGATATTAGFVKTSNLAAYSPSGGPPTAPIPGGPYSAPDSDQGTVDVIDFSTDDPTVFDVTPTDPTTGQIKAAHPDHYSIKWSSATEGKVFGVDGASGAVDANSCSSIVIRPGVAVVFGQGNTCGLLQEYDAATFKNDAKDKGIDVTADGLSETPLDPTTGIINAAHPNNYLLEWTGPTTANLTGVSSAAATPDPTSCGTATFDPVARTVVLVNTGGPDSSCVDLDGTYKN